MTIRTNRQTWEALAKVQGCAARLDILAKELCGMVDVEEQRQGWRDDLSAARRDLWAACEMLDLSAAPVKADPWNRSFWFGWLAAVAFMIFQDTVRAVLRWFFGAAR